MNRKVRLLQIAISLSVVLALALVGVAYAITISVDGDRDADWAGSGGQTPGSATDPNEIDILDNVDMHLFQWTNDQTSFYFLIDVVTVPLMTDLAPIDICLNLTAGTDINPDPSFNVQRDRCSYNNLTPPGPVSGIDTVVEAFRFSGVGFVNVYDVTTNPRTLKGSGLLGYNPLATDPVVEISVPLSTLGFSSANCSSGIPVVVYYDGADTHPDDNLPDSGTTLINCGGPTAVTLNNVQAHTEATNTSTVLVLLAAASLGLGVVGVITLRRKQHSL